MKILDEYAEKLNKNNSRVQLMHAIVVSLGSEKVEEQLSQGLDLLMDNLPARLFVQLGFQIYLTSIGSLSNSEEVYDEIVALLKKDQATTIAEGCKGEKLLMDAKISLPFLCLTLGAGSMMAFILHNKIQRIQESN